MSLFGKKLEPPPPSIQPPHPQPPLKPPVYQPAPDPSASKRAYGIAELVQLMKTIPIDQHPDLVVRVVKSTLASVGVQAHDIIEDALVHEDQVRDKIAGVENEIDELVKEIERRRDHIAQLHGEISDLSYARERWQNAESAGSVPVNVETSIGPSRSPLPPPLPPPFHKPVTAKPPELA
jgi:hypothetical protein